jgi:hypothetical protein
MGQLEPVTCLTVHSEPLSESGWLQVGAYPWDFFAGACHLRSVAAQLLLEQTFGARPDRSGTIQQ